MDYTKKKKSLWEFIWIYATFFKRTIDSSLLFIYIIIHTV